MLSRKRKKTLLKRIKNYAREHPELPGQIITGVFVSFFAWLIGKGYIDGNNLDKWIKSATDEELRAAYDKDRLGPYKQTGKKTWLMERIGEESYRRYSLKWEAEHPIPENHESWKDGNRFEH